MREDELEFIKLCKENKPKEAQNYFALRALLALVQDSVPMFDINAVDDEGWTAAHRATMFGHAEVIRVLAATRLVDWNKVDRGGWTPVHLALWCGHSGVAEIIAKQDNVNLSLKTKYGHTVAMAAVAGRSLRCVEIMAEQVKCDSWNIPDNDGVTPVMKAISRQRQDILKVLLDCPRVDPNLKDQYGNSPMMMATLTKQKDVLKVLLDCPRVDPNLKDQYGNSPMMMAIKRKETDMARMMIKCPRVDQNSQLEARIDELEEENTELIISMLEKIPKCPVSI